MFPTILLLLAIAVGGEPLPQSTLPPLPPPLLLAPVVMQSEQLPPSPDRIAELERRVAALEAEHARMGLRAQPQPGGTVIAETGPITLGSGPTTARLMPVPPGYQAQTTQATTSTSYFAASVPVGDAGACAGGSCGTSGGPRFQPFGGRFRVRR